MHTKLLAAAALVAVALPASAAAQDRAGMHAAAGRSGVTVRSGHHGLEAGFGRGHGRRDHDRDRRDRRRHDDSDGLLIDSWDREWQGDSAWRADSFNDWWHEQPWRSYPRWVQDNHDCQPSRMWWSGSGWHC